MEAKHPGDQLPVFDPKGDQAPKTYTTTFSVSAALVIGEGLCNVANELAEIRRALSKIAARAR